MSAVTVSAVTVSAVTTQLPVVVGKPYKPRNVPPGDRIDNQYTCKNPECKDAKPHATKEDGTHTHWQPTQNGSGRLERKADGEIVYHAPWLRPHVPFRLSAAGKNPQPKPRVETAEKALVRMRKAAGALVDEDRLKAMTGKGCGPGWVIAATNGHFALLEPGEVKDSAQYAWLSDVSKHHKVVLCDNELGCALDRAAIMSNERSRAVVLFAEAGADKGYIYAADSDAGEMIESCGVGLSAELTKGFRVGLDWKYLEMVLGVWPLAMWWKGDESAVVFEAAGKDGKAAWRMVVMPMRVDKDGFKAAEKARREFEAEMYPEWGAE